MENMKEHMAISQLIAKERLGIIHTSERARLVMWLAKDPKNKLVYENIKKDLRKDIASPDLVKRHSEWKAFTKIVPAADTKFFTLKKWMSIAAGLIFFSLGSVMYFQLKTVSRLDTVQTAQQTISEIHRSSKGIILLTNGQSKNLTTADTRPESVYDLTPLLDASAKQANSTQINTLVIPKGADFKAKLPDGTLVWINAESKLSFPSKFDGPQREISVEGEICLDVAHNPGKPFIVHTPHQDIKVLGTLFNVEAYSPKRVVTTLIRGKIEVTLGDKKIILHPDDQLIADQGSFKKITVNAQETIQWINGNFEFTDASLEDIVEKLGRWYDISFTFNSLSARSARFTLQVGRQESLQAILKKIEMTGRVRFRINAKNINIYNN